VPLYLTRFGYTQRSWERLVNEPEDRRGPLNAVIEGVGGRMVGFWYAFGEHDGYLLLEAPDNIAVATVMSRIAAAGSVKTLETTVLLTVEEMYAALEQARGLTYVPPGG
jgi:uncharacterized protein with GYD domain